MVSFVNGDRSSEAVSEGHWINCAGQARTQTARQRKQKLMLKLTDSGFEEELGTSPVSSPVRISESPHRSEGHPARLLSSWYLQYGDIAYKIQREKEAQYHSCKSLARQPQVGDNRPSVEYNTLCSVSLFLLPAENEYGFCVIVSYFSNINRNK